MIWDDHIFETLVGALFMASWLGACWLLWNMGLLVLTTKRLTKVIGAILLVAMARLWGRNIMYWIDQ